MKQAPALKTLTVIFCMGLLLGIDASRMDAGSAEMSVDVSDEAEGVAVNSSGSAWSPWEVKFTGLGCLRLDTNPFQGLTKRWPSCIEAAIAEGRKVASTRNCKACDVTFKGSKPEAETGVKSTKCSALVKCAAAHMAPSESCQTNNGLVGKVENMNSKSSDRKKHPNRSCLPCPPECKTCIFDDSYTNWVLGRKRFKCIMPGGGSGATCTKPAGVECGECSHRRCGGAVNNMMQMVSNYLCDNNDFKAECKWPKEFQISSNPMDMEVDTIHRHYTMTMESGGDTLALPPVLGLLTSSA